jgi:hypothetical protein
MGDPPSYDFSRAPYALSQRFERAKKRFVQIRDISRHSPHDSVCGEAMPGSNHEGQVYYKHIVVTNLPKIPASSLVKKAPPLFGAYKLFAKGAQSARGNVTRPYGGDAIGAAGRIPGLKRDLPVFY